MGHIALYVGESLPPNIVRLLSGINTVIASRWELTIVGSGLDTFNLPTEMRYFDVPDDSPSSGLSRMFAAYRRMNFYLRSGSKPVDAAWQITTPQFHAVPVMAAARRHSVPFAGRIPGNKFDEFREQSTPIDTAKTFVLNNGLLRLLRYADSVVALEEFNKKRLESHGIPSEKIRVLRHPLDTDTFHSVSPHRKRTLENILGFDHDNHTILFVGRLTRLKGMDDIVQVIESLPSAAYEFHFVGTGPYSSQLETYENTVLHGFVDPNDIHRYYQATDLYLHPSHTEVGGISWTMIEAAAVGLPVVARDIGDGSTVASFVFTDCETLISYLRSPSRWETAPYPTAWTPESLSDAYDEFLSELTGGK